MASLDVLLFHMLNQLIGTHAILLVDPRSSHVVHNHRKFQLLVSLKLVIKPPNEVLLELTCAHIEGAHGYPQLGVFGQFLQFPFTYKNAPYMQC
jgi:hypothetical protein